MKRRAKKGSANGMRRIWVPLSDEDRDMLKRYAQRMDVPFKVSLPRAASVLLHDALAQADR